MSERAESLAEQFEAVNGELIAAVEAASDEDWKRTCQGEGWSVAVTAHHIASSNNAVAGFVQAIATGQQIPPITMEMIDQGNAQHALEYANCSREETLELLRDGGAQTVKRLRGLSDEQLDRTAVFAAMDNAELSAQQFAEMILIGHSKQHLQSIRDAK
jgi:uncharacterized damage-inducible protein DinB